MKGKINKGVLPWTLIAFSLILLLLSVAVEAAAPQGKFRRMRRFSPKKIKFSLAAVTKIKGGFR
jgi:hypothetical protein